jgi:hypothetical protein
MAVTMVPMQPVSVPPAVAFPSCVDKQGRGVCSSTHKETGDEDSLCSTDLGGSDVGVP